MINYENENRNKETADWNRKNKNCVKLKKKTTDKEKNRNLKLRKTCNLKLKGRIETVNRLKVNLKSIRNWDETVRTIIETEKINWKLKQGEWNSNSKIDKVEKKGN